MDCAAFLVWIKESGSTDSPCRLVEVVGPAVVCGHETQRLSDRCRELGFALLYPTYDPTAIRQNRNRHLLIARGGGFDIRVARTAYWMYPK